MDSALAFALAFVFSFVGSIPPGTMNLTILQLGLEHKTKIAWRFAIAAALVEYPYAWLAVWITRSLEASPAIVEYFPLITALVMITLGIFNLNAAKNPSKFSEKFHASGFRRGVILSILNPLALPFWITITTYLSSRKWIDLSTTLNLHAYLLGVSIGGFILLISLVYLARKVVTEFKQGSRLKKVPGVVMIVLGLYALIEYLV